MYKCTTITKSNYIWIQTTENKNPSSCHAKSNHILNVTNRITNTYVCRNPLENKHIHIYKNKDTI